MIKKFSVNKYVFAIEYIIGFVVYFVPKNDLNDN